MVIHYCVAVSYLSFVSGYSNETCYSWHKKKYLFSFFFWMPYDDITLKKINLIPGIFFSVHVIGSKHNMRTIWSHILFKLFVINFVLKIYKINSCLWIWNEYEWKDMSIKQQFDNRKPKDTFVILKMTGVSKFVKILIGHKLGT